MVLAPISKGEGDPQPQPQPQSLGSLLLSSCFPLGYRLFLQSRSASHTVASRVDRARPHRNGSHSIASHRTRPRRKEPPHSITPHLLASRLAPHRRCVVPRSIGCQLVEPTPTGATTPLHALRECLVASISVKYGRLLVFISVVEVIHPGHTPDSGGPPS